MRSWTHSYLNMYTACTWTRKHTHTITHLLGQARCKQRLASTRRPIKHHVTECSAVPSRVRCGDSEVLYDNGEECIHSHESWSPLRSERFRVARVQMTYVSTHFPPDHPSRVVVVGVVVGDHGVEHVSCEWNHWDTSPCARRRQKKKKSLPACASRVLAEAQCRRAPHQTPL